MLDLIFAAGICAAIDGDTLDCDGRRIRLHGIDAPDFRCAGRDSWCREDRAAAEGARIYLVRVLHGRAVRCDDRGRDRYGRTVALCFTGTLEGRPAWFVPDTVSINCRMVAAGHAIDWPKYSGGAFASCGRR